MKVLNPLNLTGKNLVNVGAGNATLDGSTSSGGVTADDINIAKHALRPMCFTYAEKYGYNKIVIDLFTDDTEFTLADGAAYSAFGYVYNSPGNVNGASIVSSSETYVQGNIHYMIVPIQIVGSGSITYAFSPNGGTNYATNVAIETDCTSLPALGSQAKIAAKIYGDAKLLGWAYLIKE